MEILEIEVSVVRRKQLMYIARYLDIDDAPVNCSRDEFVSWVDCVLGLLDEYKYDLTKDEKIIIFHHLGVDANGLGCVCESLNVKIS